MLYHQRIPRYVVYRYSTRNETLSFSYFIRQFSHASVPVPSSSSTTPATLQSILDRLHIIEGDARNKTAYIRGFNELYSKLSSLPSSSSSPTAASAVLTAPPLRRRILITDPPYCILHRRRKNGDLRDSKARKRKLDHDIVVKYNSIEEYREFTYTWLSNAVSFLDTVSTPNGNIPLIIWTNALGRQPIIEVAKELGYPYVYGDYLWAKRTRNTTGTATKGSSTDLLTEINCRIFEGALVLYRQPPMESMEDYLCKPWSVVTDYHDTDTVHDQLQALYRGNSNSGARTVKDEIPQTSLYNNVGSRLMDELRKDREEQVRRTLSRTTTSLRTPLPSTVGTPSSSLSLPHPHRKPFQALAPLLLAYTKPDDIVLDPFSGTNAIVFTAGRLHRYALGIELRISF